MPPPARSPLRARLLTGLVAGLIVCTLLAAVTAIVGLVFALVTRHPSAFPATLRVIGLIYVVYVPFTMIRYAFFHKKATDDPDAPPPEA